MKIDRQRKLRRGLGGDNGNPFIAGAMETLVSAMKSRIELQDDLDMLEAAASGIRYPGPGSSALLQAIIDLSDHPLVRARDRSWLNAQLDKLRARHGLPTSEDPPVMQSGPQSI